MTNCLSWILLACPIDRDSPTRTSNRYTSLTPRKATRVSPRTPASSASPAPVHAVNDAAPAPVLDAQVPTTGDDTEDPILKATDKALATFSSKRQLLLDLGKDAFFEHAWKVKCVDTILRDGPCM